MRAAFCLVLFAAPFVRAEEAADPAARLQALLADADAAYKDRDNPDSFKKGEAALKEALAIDAKSYGALWRMARHYFWIADGKPGGSEEKMDIGKVGWDWAEKALQVKDAVEARYYAGIACGAYGQGLGILSALSQGIEGKFKTHVEKGLAMDRKYDAAGGLNALGRFYFELPWPKHDADKSIALLKEAIQLSNNLRARVYLAETLLDEDQPKEAKKLVDEVLAAKPGAYDAPEERRAQTMARALLPAIQKELE